MVLGTETINGFLWVVLGVLWQLGAHLLANGFLALRPPIASRFLTLSLVIYPLAIPKPDACFIFD